VLASLSNGKPGAIWCATTPASQYHLYADDQWLADLRAGDSAPVTTTFTTVRARTLRAAVIVVIR